MASRSFPSGYSTNVSKGSKRPSARRRRPGRRLWWRAPGAGIEANLPRPRRQPPSASKKRQTLGAFHPGGRLDPRCPAAGDAARPRGPVMAGSISATARREGRRCAQPLGNSAPPKIQRLAICDSPGGFTRSLRGLGAEPFRMGPILVSLVEPAFCAFGTWERIEAVGTRMRNTAASVFTAVGKGAHSAIRIC